MTRLALKFLVASVALSVLAGCTTAPERTLSTERPPYAALPNGFDPMHPDRAPPPYMPSGGYRVVNESLTRGVIRAYEAVRGHALNVLMLSGGGHNGAFGAGFLKGWRESGTRPQFDIVTGVSTGALLATHALLGTEAGGCGSAPPTSTTTRAGSGT